MNTAPSRSYRRISCGAGVTECHAKGVTSRFCTCGDWCAGICAIKTVWLPEGAGTPDEPEADRAEDNAEQVGVSFLTGDVLSLLWRFASTMLPLRERTTACCSFSNSGPRLLE